MIPEDTCICVNYIFVKKTKVDGMIICPWLRTIHVAYRFSVYASTNHIPNKMTLGREKVMPLQAVIGQLR